MQLLVLLSLMMGSLPATIARATESVPVEAETECVSEVFLVQHCGRNRLETRRRSVARKHLPDDDSSVNEQFQATSFRYVALSGHRLANGLLAPLLT